jgi:phospholipase C
MFVHGASSGGLDHSPSTAELVLWETLDGFSFKNGTVFDAIKKAGKTFHMYSGDEFPMVAALKGVALPDVHRISDLVADLKKSRSRTITSSSSRATTSCTTTGTAAACTR